MSLPPIKTLEKRSNLSGITRSPLIKEFVLILDGNFDFSIFKIVYRKIISDTLSMRLRSSSSLRTSNKVQSLWIKLNKYLANDTLFLQNNFFFYYWYDVSENIFIDITIFMGRSTCSLWNQFIITIQTIQSPRMMIKNCLNRVFK